MSNKKEMNKNDFKKLKKSLVGRKPAQQIELVTALLGFPEHTCNECGQKVAAVPALISDKQARDLLGLADPTTYSEAKK